MGKPIAMNSEDQPQEAQFSESVPEDYKSEARGETSTSEKIKAFGPWISRILTLVMILSLAALLFVIIERPEIDTSNLPFIGNNGNAAESPTTAPIVESQPLEVPAFDDSQSETTNRGIPRRAMLHTTIPTRARSEVVTYEVQTGDTLFIIADNFGIEAETILFGNFDFLNGNPHLLAPGDVLNILPIDGAYHLWNDGDTLEKIAETYYVEQDVIIQWPGNNLDPYELEFNENPIEPGTWLVIPGGQRDDYVDWGPPAISRTNPVSASYYGSGYCGQIYEGAIGTYNFIWPTTSTYISAYYNPVLHPAIDIAASIGYPIFASDTGVVVYSGWSVYGYGNLVVIDHGNGWQSAYAHLDTIRVSCGQSVYQGATIGTMGNTGQSTGPHLHFELQSDVYGKVDPLLYVSP